MCHKKKGVCNLQIDNPTQGMYYCQRKKTGNSYWSKGGRKCLPSEGNTRRITEQRTRRIRQESCRRQGLTQVWPKFLLWPQLGTFKSGWCKLFNSKFSAFHQSLCHVLDLLKARIWRKPFGSIAPGWISPVTSAEGAGALTDRTVHCRSNLGVIQIWERVQSSQLNICNFTFLY